MPGAPHSIVVPLRLGFGCSGAWGMPWFPAAQADAILRKAYDIGVRHFDTAGFYSGGEAERRLGEGLRRMDGVFVSTKSGTRYRRFATPQKDFSPGGVRADVEQSLRRLGRERIDLVYLHGPTGDELASGLETLDRLKQEGKIALAGVCGEGAGLARAVETPGVDAVMGVYNFLRREHAPVFRRAREKAIAVIAIAPLAQGLYRRDFFKLRSAADGWRIVRALVKNRDELAAAKAAAGVLYGVEGWTPAQAALGFVHANPDIDAALTTTTSERRLEDTAAAAGRSLPADALAALQALALDASGDGA